MNVLIVSQYFWPENFRINDLAQALSGRGHSVTVLTGMPNYPSGKVYDGYRWWTKRYDSMHGIPVVRVPLIVRRESKAWQLALNYISFALSGCLFAPWLLRKQCYDIIFVYEPSPITVGVPAVLLSKLKRAPMFFWVQDLWPESLQAAGAVHSQLVLGLVGKMVRWIYRHSDRVLVQSEGFVHSVVTAGALPERTSYFPNWAENLYRQLSLPADAPEYRELPEGFCIMFAGNLGEAQSLGTIVDAAAKLQSIADLHWVIVGDGRRMNWMRERVAACGLDRSVHFLGRRPSDAMPRYFAAADALLVTLKDDPVFALTIPSKVQSYLACGRPIVAALNGEGAEVIRLSGAGIAVQAGNAACLADAVRALYLKSADEREIMGHKARAYFEQEFSLEMLVSRLEGWMEETKMEAMCAS